MSEMLGSRAPPLLRVEIDDIHNIHTSLRRSLDEYQFLRLAVVMEECALSPYVTPREMENGELDFDRQMILPLKENLKSLFFHLYDARPSDQQPRILASGFIPMDEILSGSSTCTVPLMKNDDTVCTIAFYAELLSPTEHTEDLVFYAPSFTSPLQDAASSVRRATRPACHLCRSAAVSIFSFPFRTSRFFACSFSHLFLSLFSKPSEPE